MPLTTGFLSSTKSSIDETASYLAPGVGGGGCARINVLYIYIYIYKVSDYSRSGILADFN